LLGNFETGKVKKCSVLSRKTSKEKFRGQLERKKNVKIEKEYEN